MLEVLKDIVHEVMDEWQHRIEAGGESQAIEIDLSKDILKIFQRFLLLIIVGEDIDKTQDGVEIMVRTESCQGLLELASF